MLTPQEVSSKTFPKAMMGGYAMAQVDEFLDALTEDYSDLYKENAALKAKIKAMMEKMEEYRMVEDSMRATLLAAQKMAKEMVAEAEAKRDAIQSEVNAHKASLVADAEVAAKERMAELKAMIAAEEQTLALKKAQVAADIGAEDKKLEKAQVAVSRFMQVARANCEEQMKILQALEELVPEKIEVPVVAAPVIAAPVAVEEPVAPVWEEPAAPVEELKLDDEFFTSPLPTLDELKKVPVSAVEEMDEDELIANIQSAVNELAVEAEQEQETIWDDLPEDATRIINLDDLQFGRNYNKED